MLALMVMSMVPLRNSSTLDMIGSPGWVDDGYKCGPENRSRL